VADSILPPEPAVLAARAAIADVVYTYARNIRAGRGADCLSLFTKDGVFEIRDQLLGSSEPPSIRARLEGHDAILAYLTSSASGDTRVCPMIHNLLIEVNGNEAESSSVMTALVSNGQSLFGEYQDRFRFEDGWRFSSRTFTIMGDFIPSKTSV
jgi:SnoaL-like protein